MIDQPLVITVQPFGLKAGIRAEAGAAAGAVSVLLVLHTLEISEPPFPQGKRRFPPWFLNHTGFQPDFQFSVGPTVRFESYTKHVPML